ncbi:hypothetical protein ACIRPH_09575 [Nocardiopsis sp. NPDC101807]|uniref:hypothetical protein n=1 Tax=Nocardiopsis sp. NPDC101807 TaxID=3364339 RepID=UPI003829B0FE
MNAPSVEESPVSPVQIIRTAAFALIAGGVALGLVPGGPCGAGWWPLVSVNASFGWIGYGDAPSMGMATTVCGTAMAPVGSWAIALTAIGAALLLGVWRSTRQGAKAEPEK